MAHDTVISLSHDIVDDPGGKFLHKDTFLPRPGHLEGSRIAPELRRALYAVVLGKAICPRQGEIHSFRK